MKERLTFEGNFCDIAMCQENPCPYNGSCSQKETWERLKHYEDMEEQGRLVEIVRCKNCKHWDKDKRVCLSGRNYIFYATKPDFFCAEAEQALATDKNVGSKNGGADNA